MYANQKYHRTVDIAVNLSPTVDAMAGHMLRLVDQAKALFENDPKLAKTVQKRWYGKQLIEDGKTFGFIYFTVTNRDILKRDFDLEDPTSKAKDLEFTFHVKQCETIVLANNFTSGSLRYKARWGEFNPNRVELNLYGGSDVESAILFRDLIARVGSQLSAFTLDNNTFIAQNQLSLVPVKMCDFNNA